MKKRFAEYRKLCVSDKIFYGVVDIIMLIMLLAVLIPLLYVISSSISQPSEVLRGKVFILPK